MLGTACRLRKSLWDQKIIGNLLLFLTLISSKSIVPRSRTSTNWNDVSTASGPLWVARIECAVGEWHSIYVLAFVLEVDILNTYCNKDYVMWHVWLFLRDNNCQSHYCLLPFTQSFKYTLNYCVDGSIWHFKFPKVVQAAHTLGEVGNLGTVSLRVCSGTILPIFIEIGSYLTDKEQKISWHTFLRHGICVV